MIAGDGRIVHDQARLVDFDSPENNDWLALNQFTSVENRYSRRADVLVFLNGLPIAIIELKNPGDENATLNDAYHQSALRREGDTTVVYKTLS
ncbi:type I site-specific deoxyribonuclease, HsdR family [Gloeobacter kilaueensis JS1]|uniref:type I site-specific deoxyribonuclease n=1 Tax=Gloeobacter kilaueensis (strain ATCC BAA-2537 / CCAP 1431/1 / ULC 316 / JS1) TaxID=1183438 RepID=U5QNX8_GLOK1|nr:type I restriction endonuclease [Gloeobacter kilaueensis]AGY60598.1 type I site-specific deoxyribonuclease, HsdR family [Gloeobacter kilaueensis JS1]